MREVEIRNGALTTENLPDFDLLPADEFNADAARNEATEGHVRINGNAALDGLADRSAP